MKGIWKKKVSVHPGHPSWGGTGLQDGVPAQFVGQSLGSLGAPLFASFTPGNLVVGGCIAPTLLSPRQAPNKALFSILGKSNLRFAGMSIAVNISVDGLNLMIPTTRQVRAVPEDVTPPPATSQPSASRREPRGWQPPC